ncbi:hypothetical protein [Halorubrum halodurans]|uniref:Major facilitator superfamily (MFS) profile domain-containing protein n=1 Tax=Halorubrum halodurans TaxID=1383851 RepID=A0A256IKX6_9EURY|nr:hypothetical protein [Halorubrum halodurans]OYR57184.1 hypothetical protein DJ70_06530 [Halorubrum halodurans]
MDELLDAVDLVADAGLEGVVSWLLRAVGLIAVLAGIALWALTETGLLWIPAGLMLVGLALLAAPSLVLALAEFA